ncbi:hypothetical protein N7512_000715 [Penicillium capsulatum]|nr:hypothetical protein N7512_000715 [Penicillium capsulatum]
MAISLANSSCSPTRLGLFEDKGPPKQSMWHRLGLRRWLGRDDRDARSPGRSSDDDGPSTDSNRAKHDNLTRRLSRRVGVGLPRSTTFKRQHSERRDRLAPLDPDHRRALSADRRPLSAQRTRSPPPAVDPRLSAPEVQWLGPTPATTVDEVSDPNDESDCPPDWDPRPDMTTTAPEVPEPATLEMELEQRWILNLSMHFRDRSEREKFFVTYAETPTRWRRVTISCDYRDAGPDSLEEDLKQLRYQRDKCARIYESIRESLPDIQFYDTVTNLKVETRDGRLHVHVTEDVNETIPYPRSPVQLGGQAYIKKEIPGPDTVDEFLYEINALHALNGAPNVIHVEAIVVDEHQQKVKGLLINYAEQGALVDILYEERGRIAFSRRERWAKQIVQGLCEIHESGYVQGDFTLSNIVVDAWDNAHIIDINRRGCPVGWEPPEIAAKIESNQRISMYIGVKTDLYQLGMTLWALAMEEDEPERQPRPLVLDHQADVPDYYRRLVDICLSPTPRHRLAAKDLLSLFPSDLFSRRSMLTRGIRDLTDEPLPLFTKSNGVDPPLVTEPTNPLVSRNSFEGKFTGADEDSLSQPVFLGNHCHAKRSTPTLAGSNGDGAAAFLSRHSSASTLNHHEHPSLDRPWGYSHPSGEGFRSGIPADTPIKHPLQKVGPPSCTNAGPPETSYSIRDQPLPLQPSTSSTKLSVGISPCTEHEILKLNGPHPIHDSFDSTNPSSPQQGDELEENPYLENADSEYSSNDLPDSTPLLSSCLPINPAFGILRRRSFPAVAKDVQPANPSGQSDISRQRLIPSLLESQLPINPAFPDSQVGFPHTRVLPELPIATNPVLVESRPGFPPLVFSLSESRLPINPALRDGSEGYRRLLLSLFESQLPINPAFPDGSQNHRRSITFSPDVQLSTSRAFQEGRPGFPPLAFSLSESRLPINPALRDGSEGYRRFISSLFESQLPINPGYIEGPPRLS